MPEERPESQESQEPTGEQAEPQEEAPQAEAGGDEPEDAASAALRAAREALASIQAEADQAVAGSPAPASAQPAASADEEGGQSVADAVVQAALEAAQQQATAAPQPDVAAGAKRLELPDFDLSSVQGVQHGLDMLADVQLDVRIELGRTRMLVEDVLRLNSGAVVELDKLAGDPLDVYVNERLVARGEVLVLNDNFCIRINEIIDSVGEEAAQAAAN